MSFQEYNENDSCRICLTSNTNMIPLESSFKNTNVNESSEKPLSILNILEQVMSQKVILNEQYPWKICLMCKSLLTVAYDLHILFFNSQATLKEIFNNISRSEIIHSNNNKVAPVELIVGSQKFNLDDVLIVEDEEEENGHNFDGFLQNLGTTVSAVFVKNSKRINNIYRKESLKDDINMVDFNELSECNHEYKDREVQEDFKEDNEKQIIDSNISMDNIFTNSYKCNYCDTICATKHRLKLHMKKKHSGKEVNQTKRRKTINVKQFLCDICGHLASDSQKAKAHRQTHFGKNFECHICHKKFSYKISLNFHIKSHKSNRDYLCTICGKTFQYSNALVYHMRMHTNERNFVCNFCDKRFYMQSTWKRHLRIHTDDRPYVCSFCSKGFRSNGEKRKHEMLHTGVKPHKCKFCEKAFSSKYNQLVHHMSHSGDHGCDYCRRTFIDIEFLKRHIKDKHRNVESKIE